MEEVIYRKSLKEVYVILNSSSYEITKKLPDDLKEYIISKMDDNYDYQIDTNKSLLQQDMMDKTKFILARIYQRYLYDNTEIKRVEDEKKLKYNPKDLFKDKKVEIKNVDLVEHKESFITKLTNRIRNILKKIKN